MKIVKVAKNDIYFDNNESIHISGEMKPSMSLVGREFSENIVFGEWEQGFKFGNLPYNMVTVIGKGDVSHRRSGGKSKTVMRNVG